MQAGKYTAHVDTFARDSLPPAELQPEFLFTLPELRFAPRLNCVTELLDAKVRDGLGARVAIRSPGTTWTYEQLWQRSNQIARVLVEDLGVVPGKRVLLRGPNSPMLAASWLAVLKAGAIAVATMPLLRARDLEPILNKAECEFALCDARLDAELLTARQHAPALGKVVYFHGDDAEDCLETRMALKPGEFTNVETASDDVALIAFTSGTTGQPKGTIHYHRDVLAMCICVGAKLMQVQADDIFIGSPPLAFTYGLGMLLAFPLYAGASTVLLESAPPAELAQAIGRFRATICATAPTGYRALLATLADHDLSSLRQCVSAGEHLPLPTYEQWERATGLRLLNGLGATEMIHIFVAAAGDDIRPGASGKAIPGYRTAILDEHGQPLPPGQPGRLAVKGPTGCRYLADERQRDYVVNGWNVTGDVAAIDEDGYVWYHGRADDMIVSSGYNIAGPEVEAALLLHPAVAECAVIGVADAERGSIVKAFVVVKSGVALSAQMALELQDFVKANIAPYKYPRLIEFIDKLPMTNTGKIQRFKLRQREASSD